MTEREKLEAEIAAARKAIESAQWHIASREKEIAALQARLDAPPPELDLSEAVEAFDAAWFTQGSHKAALRAAVPAILKAYGHDKPAWPDDETLREMAEASCAAAEHMDEGTNWTLFVGHSAALEMARRIREWQEANNG